MSRLFVERGERQGLAPRLRAELGKASSVSSKPAAMGGGATTRMLGPFFVQQGVF